MGYAHGGNQKDKHFPPGVPIISKYLHSGDYSNCDKNFLVAAYVPKKPGCNATLPTPIDPSVVVKSFPAAKAYVRSFPGFGFHWTFLAEAFKMAKALEQDKVSPAQVHQSSMTASCPLLQHDLGARCVSQPE